MTRGCTRQESRTHDVEILEFVLGGRPFGVEVLQLRAIEQYDPRRVTPDHPEHPSVAGTLRYQDRRVPVIDLRRVICADAPAGGGAGESAKLVLVLEREGQLTAFLVDGVGCTHRAPAAMARTTDRGLDAGGRWHRGSLRSDGREIPLVDLERIGDDILPRERYRQAESPELVTV